MVLSEGSPIGPFSGLHSIVPGVLLLAMVSAAGASWGSDDPPAQAGRAASQGGEVAPGRTGFLSLEGGRIYYEVIGEGFPLVFIHDGLAHSEIWDEQVAAFATGYRVVRYDRRGYGRSDLPTAPFSNLDDLDRLLVELEIDRAVLIGSSSGGGLALDYTLEHPERVEALVLSGPVVDGLGYSLHFMKRAYGNFGPDTLTTVDRWADDPYAVAPGNEAARERLRDLLRSNPQNLDYTKGRWEQRPAQTTLSRLGQISAPVLLLIGDRDIPDVHAHVGAIEAGVSWSRRVIIEDAGHLPYLERPAAFRQEVEEFFSLLTLSPDSPRFSAHPVPPWPSFARGFAPVPGTDLYFEVMGEGEPVVLIHGGAIDHRMWDDQFAALASRYRVIRYDIRGHGLSKSPEGTYRSYRDLQTLLDHLGVGRAHLVGLSLGCRIAMDLAIEQPERVASLVLCSPGISGYEFNAPEEQEYLQRIRSAFFSGDFAQAAEEFVHGWCDGPRRTPEETPPAVRARVKRMALATVRPDRDLGRGAELDPPAAGRLAEVRAPTLAILGDLDMPGIHTIVGMIRDQVRGARVEVVDDAAHMVNMENPGRLQELLVDFLEDQGPADSR